MLIFGDHERIRDPRALAASLRDALSRPPRTEMRTDTLGRHAALVGAFIEAGELAQGLADAEATERGCDARGGSAETAMTLLLALARAVVASWCGEPASLEPALRLLETLRAARLPAAVALRRAEGYAFHAVYPEAYSLAARRAAAAARCPPRDRHPQHRRGLAAMVAAAARAPSPTTVRPGGDPWRRELALDPALVRTWVEDPHTTVAIADEGPGLSGSSFGAVIDRLQESGVALDRIECYPSHRGEPGPVALPRDLARWRRLRREVVDCDELLVRSGVLARWIADLVGPLTTPLADISAGAWRRLRCASEAEWPPVVVHQERRKFLAETADGWWLARYVGLGRDGERAIALARGLYHDGFVPEPRGLVHGFLVERWVRDARLLQPRRFDRAHLRDRVGRYLGRRAFLPTGEPGASAAALLAMARHNSGLPLDGWAPRIPALDRRMRRVAVDGRLHAWEWLVLPTGALVKTDAVDHHRAHDLVGCQDIAWDLAGAEHELGLDGDDLAALIGHGDRELRAFLRICYLAFQLGRHALARDSAWPGEVARLDAAVDGYRAALELAVRRAV
ncbi:MAG: hypothetical protein KIT31_08225 [Deltaproteobacteria bacterium]|nr:hypothetical protein [Deltaproteobacteria bacterium]